MPTAPEKPFKRRTLYRTGDVAQLLGLSARMVAYMIDNKTLPGIRPQSARFVPHRDLAQWLHDNPGYEYARDRLFRAD